VKGRSGGATLGCSDNILVRAPEIPQNCTSMTIEGCTPSKTTVQTSCRPVSITTTTTTTTILRELKLEE
jgi:hypothetical protein